MTHNRPTTPVVIHRRTHRPAVKAPPTGAPPDTQIGAPWSVKADLAREPKPVDPTARQCQAWLSYQAEACRLSLEWGQVEARLQAEHGWYKMPEAERHAHPGQAELDAIQARLEELDVLRDGLLPTLVALPATTPQTVALKLAVVAEIVDVADFPDAHALILRAREELLAL